MAEGETTQPSETQQAAPASPRWRDLWQVPVLVAAGAALAVGVAFAVMSRPKPDLGADLVSLAGLIEQGKHGEALETLNNKVMPNLQKGLLTPEQMREFYLLRARSLYLGQRELLLNREENNKSILAEYREAERRNAQLSAADAGYLADTLVSLGEFDEAVRRAEMLPETSRVVRVALYKRMIGIVTKPPSLDPVRALDLLTLLGADQSLTTEDRLWTLTRQARLLVSQGYAEDAITKVVRVLPRIESMPSEQVGELLVTLARAYIETGDSPEASKQLARAATVLGPDHALTAEVLLLRGEISHSGGDLDDAKERFSQIIDRYSFSEHREEALLGLAEVEGQIAARDGAPSPDAALMHFGELVGLIEQGGRKDEHKNERVRQSLLTFAHEHADRRDYANSLRFAEFARRLSEDGRAPAPVLLAIADANRKLAEQLLRDAGKGNALSLVNADPATQREARSQLLRAGDAYREHASRVVQVDTGAYADSVWKAAECFDFAGDLDNCVTAFQQFVGDLPGDARRPDAMFRLARAYQARGDLELAEKLFGTLIDDRGRAAANGPLADASFVPLAQTLLMDSDAANDGRAEELLMRVVGGEIGGPGTRMFREAILELGSHYYNTGRYALAIERLEQFLSLGGEQDANAAGRVRFRLADSYRRSAGDIASELTKAMPDGQRRERERERESRLRRAMALYVEADTGLRTVKQRDALGELLLRNAAFYVADCAFELRDFPGAAQAYEAARDRYPSDPASLVALTQIASCWLEQGDRTRAAAAHERARRFYESLPESVWDDPNLPMSRKDWQRWLDAQAELAGIKASANGREQAAAEAD